MVRASVLVTVVVTHANSSDVPLLVVCEDVALVDEELCVVVVVAELLEVELCVVDVLEEETLGVELCVDKVVDVELLEDEELEVVVAALTITVPIIPEW